jgi:hypothetical protein
VYNLFLVKHSIKDYSIRRQLVFFSRERQRMILNGKSP